MEFESCSSLCIVLIKVCEGGLEKPGSWCEVWRRGGGLICLGGHTENLSLSPGAVVGRCPIFSPWTRMNSLPCTSSWGRPLVWWTLVSHLKHWTQKRFLFLFYMRKYFILYWCKQWWQLLVVSLHRCQTNIEIRGIKIQFCWAGSTPGSPESSKVSVFTGILKKRHVWTSEPQFHLRVWRSLFLSNL